jgi:hypothetical protein
LREILGGRRGALDATLPVVAFVVGWPVAQWLAAAGPLDWGPLVAQPLAVAEPVAWAGLVAVLAAVVVAVVRLVRGGRPRAVLVGLLGVAAAAFVAMRTGRPEDFFLLQIASNAASALAFAVSIVVRWPLLGVVVGTLVRQRTRWRRDPDLLRAYQRASWVWVAQYLVRLAVFLPLYAADMLYALGVARVALTWPLVAACVALSWAVLRRSLPAEHPGLLRPVVPADAHPSNGSPRPGDGD